MFCSKCGKTLLSDAVECASCGNPVGESRFEGIPYTSAQPHYVPGKDMERPKDKKAYTKITYTNMNDTLQTEAEVDTRTAYRPVYEGSSVPEDIRDDVRRAVNPEEEAAEEPTEEEVFEEEAERPVDASPEEEFVRELFEEVENEAVLDDFDLSQLRSRPIVSEGRAGISSDVMEYVEKLENSAKAGKGRRRRRAAVYGEDEFVQDERPVAAEGEAQEDDVFNTDTLENYDENAESAEYDDAEEYEEYERGGFSFRTVLKVLVVMLIIAALGLGGWFIYGKVADIQKNSTTIEGVTQTMYDEGITLLESHQETAYVSSLLDMFKTDGIVAVTGRMTQDAAAIQALMPAEPAVNDQLFMDVLESVQENIGNAVTMDILAMSQNDANAVADSNARWQVVRDSIVQLKSAKTAIELNAVLGGQKISITTPTPEPTAVPQSYTPLAKGDKSNAVLDLQNRLWELGYLNDDRDGAFGANTQTAVKWFQTLAGLDVTGVADSMTQTLLYSDDAPRTQYAQVTPTPIPVVDEEPAEQEVPVGQDAPDGQDAPVEDAA